jgi:hypothetical protein
MIVLSLKISCLKNCETWLVFYYISENFANTALWRLWKLEALDDAAFASVGINLDGYPVPHQNLDFMHPHAAS